MIETRFWFDENNEEPVEHGFCEGRAMAYSCTSPAKTTANEDSAAIVQIALNHGLLIVADGVGGANAGDRASRTTIESIVEFTQDAVAGESLRTQILDAIEAANREVLSWGIGAGSTLVVVEYLNGNVRSFHVGDSTTLLCSNHGRIKYSTIAHAPVAMAVEIGMLEEADALNHEDRHLITNCVGSDEMKIELGPTIPMAARDTLVVGSDGLFDNYTNEDIVELIRAGDLSEQSKLLISSTRARMHDTETLPCKPDDLTVFCFRQ